MISLVAFIALMRFIFVYKSEKKQEKIDLDWFEEWNENKNPPQ